MQNIWKITCLPDFKQFGHITNIIKTKTMDHYHQNKTMDHYFLNISTSDLIKKT